jgi:hypothetical protein
LIESTRAGRLVQRSAESTKPPVNLNAPPAGAISLRRTQRAEV